MAPAAHPIAVYLETGKQRTLAGACDWPGWCRGGRDADAALAALLEYAPRYAAVLHGTRLGFHAPQSVDAFTVTERLAGNATTDYGVPGLAPSSDAAPVEAAELRRLQRVLQACWAALDAAAEAAHGKELRTGPRGGGRMLAGIIEHVQGAEASYLRSLGGTLPKPEATDDPAELLTRQRPIILEAIAAAARGEFPARGPRGGVRWSPRYFVRRAAWHVLDHVWEIEDRIL
jgi:hypothetical protein